MKKKLLILSLLSLFFSLFSSAQMHDKFWIKGKVTDSIGAVKDAHIVNLNTKKGTFTNEFGDYKIVVAIGDTLQFSSVNHQMVKRIMNAFVYSSEVLDIFMPIKTVALEEFELKRNDLAGFLTLDVKKTPIDRRAEALKRTMDFSNVDMTIKQNDDYIDRRVRPTVVITDPTQKYKGIGLGIPFLRKKKKKKIRQIERFKPSTFTHQKVYELCGKSFFENLKIPKNEVLNFIDYCNQFNIKKLYDEDQVLELAVLLEREAPNFLKRLKR